MGEEVGHYYNGCRVLVFNKLGLKENFVDQTIVILALNVIHKIVLRVFSDNTDKEQFYADKLLQITDLRRIGVPTNYYSLLQGEGGAGFKKCQKLLNYI